MATARCSTLAGANPPPNSKNENTQILALSHAFTTLSWRPPPLPPRDGINFPNILKLKLLGFSPQCRISNIFKNVTSLYPRTIKIYQNLIMIVAETFNVRQSCNDCYFDCRNEQTIKLSYKLDKPFKHTTICSSFNNGCPSKSLNCKL